ncbi:sirohydrochlorin chelatase [Streptomyces sp. NPDC059373]
MTALEFSGPEPFDSTAQLMTQITAQLSSQLTGVALHRRGESRRETPTVPTLVAVAHGSRDPEALRTAQALLDRIRAVRPGLPVRLGHIELNEPLLGDTLSGLRGDVVLVPLLLSRGYHVKQDIPQALAGAPHLRGVVAGPLGPHPLLAEALHGRLAEAGWRASQGSGAGSGGAARSGVVLAAAGSRDPESARDTARTAALLRRRLGGIPVVPAFATAGPTVTDSVNALLGRGRDLIAVASCFASPGRFATQTAAAAPWLAAAPLGAHPAMARLVLHRYDQALAAAAGPAWEQLATA